MPPRILRTDPELSTLLIRLGLGLVMFPHGAQKLLGLFGGAGFSGTLEAFAGMGLPTLIGVLVILGEFFGSLALIVGFLSRLAATGIGIIMLGAAWMHRANGFFMNWYGVNSGEGFEYHILAIAICLALVIKGSGALSVDRVLYARMDPRRRYQDSRCAIARQVAWRCSSPAG